MSDHDYTLTALQEACGDNNNEYMEVNANSSKTSKFNMSHTPLKSLSDKKKMKGKQDVEEEKFFVQHKQTNQ